MITTTPWTAPEVAIGTPIEAQAAAWIEPYGQARHLMRTRDWLLQLDPTATVEMRLAAMTHDIERMFPGGPVLNKATEDWDDPFYLYAHMLRSAEAVGMWLIGIAGPAAAEVNVAEVRRLVGLHEVGGLRGADEIQAADSLSWLETLTGLAQEWVASGVCSRDKAAGKLTYMAERVRVPKAHQYIAPLLEWALDQLPASAEPVPQAEVTR